MASSGKPEYFSIRSEGDLEVAILHENQEAFTDIVNPDLYAVVGEPPDQNIVFHNDACFYLFVIRAAEVFAEGTRTLALDDKYRNFSLFDGSRWLCERHPEETDEAGLRVACEKIGGWLEEVKSFSFWCGMLDTQFEITMPRRNLLKYGGNITKHSILRLNRILSDLHRSCEKSGFDVSEAELLELFEPFTFEIYNRLQYHSTYLIEMLYDYFVAINKLVIRRHENNPTNRVAEMTFPEGVTSDAYKNLYGDVLVFLRYDESRFKERRPHTTKYLKMRY